MHARRSEEKPAIEETLRHSGLDPESSSSFNFCGALRRRKRFWIPGQARNDEVLGVSPGVGFGNARRNPCFLFCGALRRRNEPADYRPPYENRPAKLTPGAPF
jgi:hypothetical protein